MADSELVYSVESVELSILESNPPQLAIHAKGTARTPGYTDPTLSEIIYVTPPADGMYEYEFKATRPTGMEPQVLTPIETRTTRESIPRELKGVRVKSATNTAEAKLPDMANS